MEALPLLSLHMCLFLPRDFMEMSARHGDEWASSRSLCSVSRYIAAGHQSSLHEAVWWETQHHRAESLHPAGPRHASETGTQRHLKSTSKYLHSFPIFKFCYHSFMSVVSWPPRRFTEFGSCLSCIGCTDLTHITSYKASKILSCNKLFISTKSISRLQHSPTDFEGYNIDLKMHGWFSLSCDSKDG